EDALHRTDLTAHQQLQVPGRARIEAVLVADDEDRHLVEVRYASGIHVGEADEIQVAEADDVAELTQLDAIEDPATYVARALEGVLTVAQHGNGMLARLEILHQETVLVIAQQVATDGGRIQMGDIEVDEGVAYLFCSGLVDALGFAALERLVDITAG